LRGLLAVAGVSAVLGLGTTSVLPEPAGRTLEDVGDGDGPSETRTAAVSALAAEDPERKTA
jgi:hypothetical protein